MRAAKSVPDQCARTWARPRAPNLRASGASVTSRSSACANASSSRGTRRPVSPSTTVSSTPPSPTATTGVAHAWVLSDLGRQADALAALQTEAGRHAEREAASALIHWRTEQTEVAKREFAEAVQTDPVWMQPHWAEHNYSAKAAGVYAQLRAAEIARRKEEEAKKHRAATIGGVPR